MHLRWPPHCSWMTSGHSPQPWSLAAGHCAATLTFMRQHAQPFLQGLLRDNYGAFAELFTAAVLQAAVTGEAVLDEELGRLAQQDVSRFQQLNQRLQVTLSWGKVSLDPGIWWNCAEVAGPASYISQCLARVTGQLSMRCSQLSLARLAGMQICFDCY